MEFFEGRAAGAGIDRIFYCTAYRKKSRPGLRRCKRRYSFRHSLRRDGCLFVFPMDEWNFFTQKLHDLPLTKKEARQFSRFFLAGAASCEVDKQGRILLPSVLREFAGLDKDAVLVGVSSRIEIWSKSRWDEINDVDVDDMDDIAEHMADLGISF